MPHPKHAHARPQRQAQTRQAPQRPARSRRPSRPSDRTAAAPRRTDAPSALELALAASAEQPTPQGVGFAGLGLPQALVTGLERRGISTPSPIQARTLPDALAGRDLLGRAETGSGKTLAFGLPLLARLAGSAGTARARHPRALVLVPTRELAEQVKEALSPLAQPLRLRVTAVYGGASMNRQVDALGRGADVVVATPGRLEDHLRQGTASLDDVVITVLDEADYMADLGFLPAVRRLLDAVAAGTQRLLFSATLDRGVGTLVDAYLTDPALHAVASAVARVDSMEHLAFTVTPEQKVAVASQIAARPGRTLLFVRTKHGADRLARQLGQAGVTAGAIHGNLRQSQRQRALDAFASGQARVLVATDVAARGIHVDDIDLVVHFDPPADHKDYLHRSGRTARAGARGTVLSLLLHDQLRDSARLHEALGTDVVPVAVSPDHPAVVEVGSSGTPVTPPPARTTPAAAPARAPQHRARRPRRTTGSAAGRGSHR